MSVTRSRVLRIAVYLIPILLPGCVVFTCSAP